MGAVDRGRHDTLVLIATLSLPLSPYFRSRGDSYGCRLLTEGNVM